MASLLSGKIPEQPVVFPMVVANHAARLFTRPLREVLTRADLLAETLFAAYQLYRYDFIMVFTDTLVEAEALGARVTFPEDDEPLLTEPVAKVRLADPEHDGRMPVILKATRQLKQRAGNEVEVVTSLKGPFSLASFLAGTEKFLAGLVEQPARMHDYLAVALANQKRYARAIVQAGGVPFIGDPMASGSLISPEMFREFAQPYLTELVQEIHKQGTWVGLHICGDSFSLLTLMKETGADVLSIDEMDMAQVRRRLGPETIVMGNVATTLLLEGTPAQVRTASEECLKRGLPRLILSSACDVPPTAPVENVRALVQAAREWEPSN